MMTRTILTGLLALVVCANAQAPKQGGGRMGRFGRGPGETFQAPPPGGGGGGGARFLGAEAGMPGRVVKNAPYAADIVTESTHTLADGNRIRQTASAKVYRDSEGRTRREQSLTGLAGLASGADVQQVVFINDPVAGVNYALNPKDRTATKSTFAAGARGRGPGPGAGPGPRPAAGQNPPPRQRESAATPNGPEPRRLREGRDPNVKTESLGRQNIEGVPADGTRTTLTIPAGQMGNELAIQAVTETWYSPELQTVVLSRRSDPRSGETTFRLANISRSEPSRVVFEPPVDYKVTESANRMGRGPAVRQ